eukprot:g80497.t1
MPGPRPIVCLETGQVYPSISEAMRTTGVHRKNISHSLMKGYRAGGYHWYYLDDEDDWSNIVQPTAVQTWGSDQYFQGGEWLNLKPHLRCNFMRLLSPLTIGRDEGKADKGREKKKKTMSFSPDISESICNSLENPQVKSQYYTYYAEPQAARRSFCSYESAVLTEQ